LNRCGVKDASGILSNWLPNRAIDKLKLCFVGKFEITISGGIHLGTSGIHMRDSMLFHLGIQELSLPIMGAMCLVLLSHPIYLHPYSVRAMNLVKANSRKHL